MTKPGNTTAMAPPRTVLITGAGHGIGQAIAAAFAATGDAVIVSDLDLTRAEDPTGDPTGGGCSAEPGAEPKQAAAKTKPRVAPRQVVLYVHLAGDAVAGLENTHTVISAEQVRAWCGTPDTQIIIRPVLDLNQNLSTDAYQRQSQSRRNSEQAPFAANVPQRLRADQILENLTAALDLRAGPAQAGT